ncbi:MAG: tRNA (adenosine(37)-N6)-dimethylallyltransferase MiaA [Ignavibacteriales bacterium]|nr:tRNA (adenosine(37)-N6)-dimethylallyltransferase MiaA [Ignavibacteriales bacterium]
MERKVIVLVGPTCSGKTTLSLLLAEKLKTEIISADSRQIFKQISIGTAKPNKLELKKVTHYFIDYLNLDDDFNVSKFEKEALEIIDKLLKTGKIPIVVGGSGLYIKAVVDGIFNNVDVPNEIRNSILEERNKFGNDYIYQKLKRVDSVTAEKLLPQNWKRVLRALEVFCFTGKPIWQFQNEYVRKNENESIQFGLLWERSILYENVNSRVDKMISEGLVEEVKEILKNYNKKLNSLNTVGYKEIIECLEGKISLEKAIELIKRNTRHYAKRQITWFNKDKRINWIPISSINELGKIAEIIIQKIKN